MNTKNKITLGVEVVVQTQYQEDYSNPSLGHHVFLYTIQITNHNSFTVQLLRRHWDIIDSNNIQRIVDGDGVVGEQPILHAGETHTYTSGCNLSSEIGKMSGWYEMQIVDNGKLFQVVIPEFLLITPGKLN
jgi:ApaG protein